MLLYIIKNLIGRGINSCINNLFKNYKYNLHEIFSDRNNRIIIPRPLGKKSIFTTPNIYIRVHFTFQTQIFEIIDTLGIHELHVLPGRSSIGIAQVTLQSYVIIFDGTTGETVLVQTSRETSLLGRGVDQGVVQSTDHFVRDAFEGPWPQADIF